MSSSQTGQSRPVEADQSATPSHPPTAIKKATIKARAAEEVRDILGVAAYLAAFLSAFALYRALITSELNGTNLYWRFGVSIIGALIVAKAIVIGDKLKLGDRRKESALIWRTLYQSFVYTLFVCAFGVLEKIIEGFVHGESIKHTLQNFLHLGWDELGARALVILVALIPFFALRDLVRMAGRDPFDLIFRRHARGPAT